MTEEKKLKVVFDPAFFEAFEGTQEELDAMMEEIMGIFEGKTAEEIRALSTPVDWEELDEDDAERLAQSLFNAKNDIKPTLQ
jgi:hypothetical protein